MSDACPSGKDRLTRKEAKRLARDFSRLKGEKLGFYRCSACNAWHVGVIVERSNRFGKKAGRKL